MVEGDCHLVAIAFRGGNVVFDGPRNGRPLGVHQAHHMVAQLAACAIEVRLLIRLQVDDNTELRRVFYILHFPLGLLQLPAPPKPPVSHPSLSLSVQAEDLSLCVGVMGGGL